MSKSLSGLERRVLDYLIEYLHENTFQPSVREIGERFGIRSTKTVSEVLQSLADKGLIERQPARSRGVRILNLDLGTEALQVPQYGEVAAGDVPLDPDGVSGRIAIDRSLAPSAAVFFLSVQGDSMDPAGIKADDLVLVEPADEEEVPDGATVAVRADGKPMVKAYFRVDGRRVLKSAHPDYPPMIVDDIEDFALLGRIVGLYRCFPG